MGFSRRQMRRECADEMRRVRTLLLSLFAAAVILIWVHHAGVRDKTPRDVWFSLGLSLAAGGIVGGMTLLFTGDEWLIRHSEYGRSLTALGNARALMEQIDAEAAEENAWPHVLLLRHFLILFEEKPTPQGRSRSCAVPIPAGQIERIAFVRDGIGTRMRVIRRDQAASEAIIADREEGQAILQWIEAQEIKTEWNK